MRPSLPNSHAAEPGVLEPCFGSTCGRPCCPPGDFVSLAAGAAGQPDRLRRAILRFSPLCILFAVALATGCGPSFKPRGYLATYEGLEFVGGNSDLAYAIDADAPEGRPCTGIYLPPVLVRDRIFPEDGEIRSEITDLLQQRLYYWLKLTYKDAGLQVSTTPPDTATLALAGKYAFELETAITEVRRGSGFVRWLLGFYLGASTFQVEGTLRTLPEREVLARYVCRVVFSGDSYGGLNPKALSNRYCLRVSADWAGRDVAGLAGIVFPQLVVEPTEAEPDSAP